MSYKYFGPSYLKEQLYRSLNEKALFDIEYIDIKEYINSFKTADDVATVKNKLNGLKIIKYAKAFQDDDFIKELISIKDELIKYEVNDINVDKELKQILSCIDIKYEFNYKSDYSNCFVLDVGYDLFETKIVNKLIELGGKKYCFEVYPNKQYITRTVNYHQEAELVAQDIINNNYNLNDCAVVLCDNQNANLYESVFNRYKIPYEYNGKKNNSAQVFVNIVDYYLNKNNDSYLNLINSNILVNSNLAINNYLNRHSDDYNQEFNRFENDESYFKNLEENAKQIKDANQEIINKINNCHNLLEAFDCAYSLLNNKEEKKQIETLLANYYSSDITEDKYENIKSELLSLRIRDKYEESLLLTALNKPIYGKKYLYVLDASNTNYPKFKSFEGIVKEENLIGSNYPSISLRRDNHISSLRFLKQSEKTIFIVPEVNYEGKSIEPSLEIKAESINISVVENELYYDNNHNVDSDLTKETLIKNNSISGSISSFEKYQSCPYAYFLRYVLGLKKEDDKSLSSATIGTLFHKVLETLIKNKQKEYINFNRKDIENIIEEDITLLKKRYPYESVMIDFTKNNFIDALLMEQKFLRIMEEESQYNKFKTEYSFNREMIKNNDLSIRLNGFIDRIDEKDKYFRILDYKSSKKDLSLADASKGLKLQLFTYAYMYSLESRNIPTGVFYVKLNTSKESNKYYKYTKTKGVEIVDSDYFEEYIKNQRLSGISFGVSDADYLYTSTKTIKSSNVDFDTVKEGLESIYSYIVENILAGNFEDKPVKDACEYCDFNIICHHSANETYERDAIYDFKGKK